MDNRRKDVIALAECISAGMRWAQKETGLPWPDNTIVVCHPWSILADRDSIVGQPIYVSAADFPDEFIVAIPADHQDRQNARVLKAFKEYREIYKA